ncbi:MAG: insulinase family protein [Candidatus Magnetoovum sp. WYHC-5]|nr:insulinase family protein [Candidatus Magnetoovum sp. WYHC-5]
MFKRLILDNGIPLVMESISGVRSIAAGIWVKAGARFETPEINGISHFIEHMMFKGTSKRTQQDIAKEMDSLGGDINAFTTREYTVYYIKVLDEYIADGLDILCDIFNNPLIQEQDIEKEKGVIKEEINMTLDTPDDYIHDYFYNNVWGQESLGLPVLGNIKTISRFKRSELVKFIDTNYNHNDTIVSCGGKVDFDRIYQLFNEKLGAIPGNAKTVNKSDVTPVFRKGINVLQKELSEVHVCLGVAGIKQNSTLRYPFLAINTLFGGGISSRLFQEIRENRGLAYSIYSFLSSYSDTGLFGVYAGSAPDNYVEVIELVVKELKHLKETITHEEVERAKNHLKGNLLLNMESSTSRMLNVARQEIYYDRYYQTEEIIRGVEAITTAEVVELLSDLVDVDKMAVSVLGPADKSKLIGII